ncbi:MAG: hypothetical protein WBL63_12350 [Candidatus Acidiferrum sp.]
MMANGEGNAIAAIVWGGTTCGVMDITAALMVYGYFGLRPMPLLQGIARGVLGPRASEGGLSTAALGLLLHFVIAFGAATVYFVASRKLGFLVEQPVIWGPLYGVAVYFFMQRVVLPLSLAAKRPFSVKMMVVGVVIHIFCVGLPIAVSVWWKGR